MRLQGGGGGREGGFGTVQNDLEEKQMAKFHKSIFIN